MFVVGAVGLLALQGSLFLVCARNTISCEFCKRAGLRSGGISRCLTSRVVGDVFVLMREQDQTFLRRFPVGGVCDRLLAFPMGNPGRMRKRTVILICFWSVRFSTEVAICESHELGWQYNLVRDTLELCPNIEVPGLLWTNSSGMFLAKGTVGTSGNITQHERGGGLCRSRPVAVGAANF